MDFGMMTTKIDEIGSIKHAESLGLQRRNPSKGICVQGTVDRFLADHSQAA